MFLEVSKRHHCKLDKFLINFKLDHNLCFSFVFEYYESICILRIIVTKYRFPSFITQLKLDLLYALFTPCQRNI